MTRQNLGRRVITRRSAVAGCIGPLVAGVVLALATACGSVGSGETPRRGAIVPPRILASDALLADAIADMTNRVVEVESLVPAGVDPMTAVPTGADLARLETADLIVWFGPDHTPGYVELFEQVSMAGKNVLEIGPLMDPLDPVATDTEPAHDETSPFPWLDPNRMTKGLAAVSERMAQTRVELATDEIEMAFADYEDTLAELDLEIANKFSSVSDENRVLVSAGAELAYFGDRYGFAVDNLILDVGATDISDQVGSAQTVYVDHVDPRKLDSPRTVAVVGLHTRALPAPGSPPDTYQAVLRTNAAAIAAELGIEPAANEPD